jgi:hypothetical protein
MPFDVVTPIVFLRRYIALRNPWVMQRAKVVQRNTGDHFSNPGACSRQAQSNVLFFESDRAEDPSA